LDFDDGYIYLKQPSLINEENNEKIKSDNEVWIDARKKTEYPIRIGKENDEKFKVDWEGTIETEGTIKANSGRIG
jgi:hypothetical protein